MGKNYEIDNVDLKILALLTEDAKIPYTEIAKKVYVSGGTVHVRMRKMEEMGIVKGTTLSMDYSKLGIDVTAFMGIYLERSSLYDKVTEKLKEIPEIVKMHYTTGNYSIFIKIHCRDTRHPRQNSKSGWNRENRNLYFVRRKSESTYSFHQIIAITFGMFSSFYLFRLIINK